jgi:hypothetical protein
MFQTWKILILDPQNPLFQPSNNPILDINNTPPSTHPPKPYFNIKA